MVISGCAFIPSKSDPDSSARLIVETIGTLFPPSTSLDFGVGSSPNLVHVPTHYYKIILTRTKLAGDVDSLSCAAFLVPNSSPLEYLSEDTTLSPLSFVIKLSDLESIGEHPVAR